MKIAFTYSRNPGLFAKAIKAFSGEWSHCVIITGHQDPTGDEICTEASADCGIRPTFWSKLSHHKHRIYAIDETFDWKEYKEKYHGERYAYAQVVMQGINQIIRFRNPFTKGQHCAEYIGRTLLAKNKIDEVECNKLTPDSLEEALKARNYLVVRESL